MSSSANKKIYIHVVIMFLLGYIVSILPPIGQITPMGMDVLGVFVILIYGWIFVDIFWISLIGFFLLGLTNVSTIAQAFITAFSNQTVITMLIVFALAAGLNELGIGDMIANYILSRKFLIGKPWVLIAAFVATAFFLSVIGKGMIGCILLCTIAGNILKACDYEDRSPLMSFLFCMIGYGALLPMNIIPFQPTMLMNSAIYTNAIPNLIQPFGAYMLIGCAIYAVTFIIMILLAKYVFHIDASKFNITEEMCNEFAQKKPSKVTKVAMITLCIYVLILILPEFLPATIPGVAIAKKIGLMGWTIIFLGIFSLWRDKETGAPALSLERCFGQMQWTTIMLVSVTLPVSNALSNADVGVMATIAQWITPILSGFSIFGLYVFAFILVSVLSQFLHNMVVAVLFLPLFGTVAISMGANPYILYFLMFMGLNTAYATPAGCGTGALIFGNKQIERKYAYIWGLLVSVIMTIVAILLYPVYGFIF